MSDSIELREKWADQAKKILMGKTITNVRYLTDDELEDFGWDESCLAIFLNDGGIVFPSADDEGNRAGAWFTTNDDLPVIPTIRI